MKLIDDCHTKCSKNFSVSCVYIIRRKIYEGSNLAAKFTLAYKEKNVNV